MVTILQLKVTKGQFFENLSLEPNMDVLSQTLMQVVDITYYSIEYEENASLFNIILNVFSMHTYSQVTFTQTVRLSGLPTALYTVQV